MEDAPKEIEVIVVDRADGSDWLDAASQEGDDVEVEEYDIVSSPNDWNFSTIVSFIGSGAMKVPSFQRNYVWDRKRASKLIESLLIGLPVPQVFLYEEDKNSFLVIDGQQRLLTLYFFAKGRFPRPTIRGSLREHLHKGFIDEDFLEDDKYFEPFKLLLPRSPTGRLNKFHGLTYKGLKEDRTSLDLRTIRNTVVKQTSPQGNSAVFEIFSRLNTGGVNLTPQEIRASLYHSAFFTEVIEMNSDPAWRHIVGMPTPDSRMRDTEFLLRALALAESTGGFSGSLANFINAYCLRAKKLSEAETASAVANLKEFLTVFMDLPSPFLRSGRFSGVLFESAYAAWGQIGRPKIEDAQFCAAIESAKLSEAFAETLQEGSTKPVNIRTRIGVLREALEAAM